MRRLTRAEEERARDRSVPDLIGDNVRLLLVGINPSLSSGATGFHFATPGNRLWPALHGAGLTLRQLDPSDTKELLASGIGISNLVNRATRDATSVGPSELRNGARVLRSTVIACRPKIVAVLGIGAYRTAFDSPDAQVGPQPNDLGASALWLLPNPSGLNTHYPVARLVDLFGQLRMALASSADA